MARSGIDHGERIAADHGLKRSSKWPAVKKRHKAKQPACIVCGMQRLLNVHHKYPFHFVVLLGRSDLELDERNLFTIDVDKDEDHHILVGHLGDYQSYNPHLEETAALCRGLLGSQIRAMGRMQEMIRARPKRFGDMTKKERDALRDELDRVMPIADRA